MIVKKAKKNIMKWTKKASDSLTFVGKRKSGSDKGGRIAFAFCVRGVQDEHEGGRSWQIVRFEQRSNGRVELLIELSVARPIHFEKEGLRQTAVAAGITFDQQRRCALIADDTIAEFVGHASGHDLVATRLLLSTDRIDGQTQHFAVSVG